MKTSVLITFLVAFGLIFSSCHSNHDHETSSSEGHSHDNDHHHKETQADHSAHHDHSHTHSSENLAAHVHGELGMSIAVDGHSLYFQVGGAADSLLGFEHEPQTDEQKQKWEDLKSTWSRSGIVELFNFSKDLNCHGHSANVQMKSHGNHMNIEIEGHIMCNSKIKDVSMSSGFIQDYKRLHKLRVDVLPEESSPYSKTFENNDGKFELSL